MKHLRYLRYLLRHKWYVFLAGLRLGVPIWRLIIHDWSKFLPSEWFPYVNYFYGNGDRRKGTTYYDAANTGDSAFDVAWLKHQHRNPHHWQHWVLSKDDGTVRILRMPRTYRREMLADWMGAGKALGKPNTDEWYWENYHRIQVDELTRASIRIFFRNEFQQVRFR